MACAEKPMFTHVGNIKFKNGTRIERAIPHLEPFVVNTETLIRNLILTLGFEASAFCHILVLRLLNTLDY